VSDLKLDRQRRDLHKSNLPVASQKIGPVSHQIHSDSPGVIEIQKLAAYELSAIISNNAIGNTKPMYDVLDELSRLF
jgi:hypothetical protein